jgi:hypothetical protein
MYPAAQIFFRPADKTVPQFLRAVLQGPFKRPQGQNGQRNQNREDEYFY